MRIQIITFLLFVSFSVFAWEKPPTTGTVYLQSGEQVSGTISIDFWHDVVVVTNEEDQKIVNHASMIEQVVTVDQCQKARTFRVFPYDEGLHLFQLVTHGKIKLLRRIFDYESFGSEEGYTIDRWFVLAGNNQPEPVKNFKRQVLPLMDDRKEELEQFAEANNIKKLKRVENMFLLVSFYNSLNYERWVLTN
jgi:hypothetical protein